MEFFQVTNWFARYLTDQKIAWKNILERVDKNEELTRIEEMTKRWRLEAKLSTKEAMAAVKTLKIFNMICNIMY